MKKIFYSPYYPLIEFGFFVIVGTVAGLYGFWKYNLINICTKKLQKYKLKTYLFFQEARAALKRNVSAHIALVTANTAKIK